MDAKKVFRVVAGKVAAAALLCVLLPFVPCLLLTRRGTCVVRSAEYREDQRQDQLRRIRDENPQIPMSQQQRRRRLSLPRSEDPNFRETVKGKGLLPSALKRRFGKAGSFSRSRSDPSFQKRPDSCRLLSQLPLEIRRLIYQQALGNSVLHIFYKGNEDKGAFIGHSECLYCYHCQLHGSCGGNAPMGERSTVPISGIEPWFLARPRCQLCCVEHKLHNEHGICCEGRTPKSEQLRQSDSKSFSNKFKGKKEQRGRLSLLLTCQQIYSEAIDILYSHNTFEFKHLETIPEFSSTILPQRVSALRSIQYTWPFYGSGPFLDHLRARSSSLGFVWPNGLTISGEQIIEKSCGDDDGKSDRQRHTMPALKEVWICIMGPFMSNEILITVLLVLKEVVLAANFKAETVVVDLPHQVVEGQEQSVDSLEDLPFVIRRPWSKLSLGTI